jgi:hypothetical protein
MPFPKSFWTGKVNATASISGVMSSSFQGDLNLEISLGPALQGENLSGSAAFPASTNKIGGSITGNFNGNVTSGDQSSQGSGTVNYVIGGTYDPKTHKISINTAVVGMQATGQHASPSGASAVSINIGTPVAVLGTAPNAPPPPMSIGTTASDPNNWVSDCAPGAPNASQPITLDLQQSGTQTIVQTFQDSIGLGLRTTTWNITLDPHQVTVEIDPTELDPTTKSPQATLTVTVSSNGQPAKMESVNLQICTYLGGMSDDDTHAPDGHLHDQRTDMCDHSSRPAGQLRDTNGLAGPSGNTYGADDYPLMATTGLDGKITIIYIPPQGGSVYISGKDQITASLATAPNTKDQTDITTQVPDLSAAPGSSDGSGGGTYYFVSQHGPTGHGFLFYGTDSTNQALVQIANAFYNAQIACSNGAPATNVLPAGYSPNPYNTDPLTNAPRTYTTPGEPMKLRITAMSLPWGGSLDIGCGWNPPHHSHSTGKVADLGWADFQAPGAVPGPAWNMDLIYLLGAIILSTPGASMNVNYEGGDLDATLQHFSGKSVKSSGGTTIAGGAPTNAHFHVQFSA